MKIGPVDCWAVFDVECAKGEVEHAKDCMKHARETWSEGVCALVGSAARWNAAEVRLHKAITVREGHVCGHHCNTQDELF